MKRHKKFKFKVGSSGDVAYLTLPLPKNEDSKSVRTVRLHEFVSEYSGPDVLLDFNSNGHLLGIEILLD